MASWKKIIVSGSQAELAAVSASNLTNDNILVAGAGGVIEGSGITYDGSTLGLGSSILTSTGATSILTGSFSGSFTGDGSGLTGVASDLSIKDQNDNTDTVNLLSDELTFSGSNGFDFTVSDNKLTLNSPQKLGITDSPTFGTGSFAGVSVGDLNINTAVANGAQLQSGGPLSIDVAALKFVGNTVSSSIIPIANQAFDLGSASYIWDNIHGRSLRAGTLFTGTITGSNATLTILGDTIDIDAASELSIDAANAITITSTGDTVRVEGTTFDGDNVTIPGNLYVNGDTVNVNTANLDVEDSYILLRSGSATAGDSGIIFGGSEGNAQSGSLLFWDASYNTNDGRLSVKNEVASDVTGNIVPDYHVAGVIEGSEATAETAQADHPGNIRIDGGDIFIYV